jgi:glycosyltransferase involved in cell wall biosynthesis
VTEASKIVCASSASEQMCRRCWPPPISSANRTPRPSRSGSRWSKGFKAGLPVVTSGVGGACEIVDASCGVLTPPGDSTALADALKRLVIDRELRARLGAAARRRPAVLCDASRQMRRIHQVLSSVAAA